MSSDTVFVVFEEIRCPTEWIYSSYVIQAQLNITDFNDCFSDDNDLSGLDSELADLIKRVQGERKYCSAQVYDITHFYFYRGTLTRNDLVNNMKDSL